MTAFIVSLLIKVTLIFSLGLIASASLRSFAPSVRHQVLLVTLGSSLLLPVVIMLAPRWDVRMLPSIGAANAQSAALLSRVSNVDTRPSTPSAQPSGIAATPPAASLDARGRAISLPLVWALGFLAVLAWLTAGRIRLRRIASGSWPLTGADWERELEEESREAGVSRPIRLLSSSVVSTPLTWGSRAPVILLPEDALDWPEAHRRIVLRHELAHVARGDALSQLVAGLVCALYWFHPLVWITERRLRAECERACDDRVVSLGTPAPEYAAHLLEVARSARSFGAPGFLSVAMARPSQLEGRLLAVLNESRRRAAPSPGARAVGLLISISILVTVSAFRAVPRTDPSLTAASPVKVPNVVKSELVSRAVPAASKNVNAVAANVRISALDSTFQRSAPARDGGTLTLDLRTGGHVTITGWDKNQVLVDASLGGRDWRDTDVTFNAVEGGARLASEYTGHSKTQSFSHTFDIHVPRTFNVQITSAGGGITINRVDGYFTGRTGGGEIEIRNASGRAEIRTGGGDVRVSDSRLIGSVNTGGGRIMIERVSGNFAGYSGSGPVTYINSDGGVKGKNGGNSVEIGSGTRRSISASNGTTTTTYVSDGVGKGGGFGTGGIRMSSNGGAISLPEAPDGARVTTGGGAIRIGPSAGEVYASTGGGLIDIGPASGSVEAHTGAGNVTIMLTGAGSHSVDVTSGNGQVVLVVPRDLSATLELESAYTNNLGHETRIESDWPLAVTSTRDWDSSEGTPRKYVRVRQAIGGGGGGGVIRVRTVNGNVVLRRSN
jgi:beta-lactamase regulating signal transducer with metallopeptidase domain